MVREELRKGFIFSVKKGSAQWGWRWVSTVILNPWLQP